MALTFEPEDSGGYDKYTVLNRIRKTSFIITLPDSSITQVDIQKMLEAGMTILRIGMSTTTVRDRRRVLKLLRMASNTMCQKYAISEWPVATWLDLKNCMVRTGSLEEKVYKIPIRTGSVVTLTRCIGFMEKCNENIIFVDNPYLTEEIRVGSEISIAGDEIILLCQQIVDDKTLKCVVTKGGDLRNLSIVSVRGGKRRRSQLSNYDKDVLDFACQNEVDIIGINYVSHVETVREVKLCLRKTAHRPLIISDICTEEGLENIDDIIKESDGIVIQRAILPYELQKAKRFRWMQIQKWIISKCEQAGKPCFLSGGILEDAITSQTIVYNEMFDVANAVIDGVTGLVLENSDDIEITIECIKLMDDLCCEIEPCIETRSIFWRQADEVKMPINAAEACMLASIAAAIQSAAIVIILPTVTGTTVRQLARIRLPCLVIALSTSSRVNRMLQVYRSVIPLKYTVTGQHKSFAAEVEQRVNYAIDFAVTKGYLQFGDYYVTLSRQSEASAYCDCVATWRTLAHKQALVSCNE